MADLFLHEIVLKFTQDGDDFAEDTQHLNVSLLDAGAGPFLCIDTDRWSFNKPREFVKLLRRIHEQCEPLFEKGME